MHCFQNLLKHLGDFLQEIFPVNWETIFISKSIGTAWLKALELLDICKRHQPLLFKMYSRKIACVFCPKQLWDWKCKQHVKSYVSVSFSFNEWKGVDDEDTIFLEERTSLYIWKLWSSKGQRREMTILTILLKPLVPFLSQSQKVLWVSIAELKRAQGSTGKIKSVNVDSPLASLTQCCWKERRGKVEWSKYNTEHIFRSAKL